jgi:hypothetical protein
MTLLYLGANALSVTVFLTFGVWCLFAGGMREDFDRFGLSRFRILTGALEVAGALGLVAGYFISGLAAASGIGLAMLMTIGLITRVRQRDTIPQMLPATALIVVNVFIAAYALTRRT